VEEWLAAAGDVSLAYVSSRKDDGTEIHRRVVIIVHEGEEPSYVINAPKSTKLWVVHPHMSEHAAVPFDSLRNALNSIRPVLHDPKKAAVEPTPSAQRKRLTKPTIKTDRPKKTA
jgi:hypothetical protein